MKKFIKSKKGLVALLADARRRRRRGVRRVRVLHQHGSGTGSATVGTSSPIDARSGTVAGHALPGRRRRGRRQRSPVDNPASGSTSSSTRDPARQHHHGRRALDLRHVPTSSRRRSRWRTSPIADGCSRRRGTGDRAATGTLQMHDTGVNQDDCKGAPLTLHLTQQLASTLGGGAVRRPSTSFNSHTDRPTARETRERI